MPLPARTSSSQVSADPLLKQELPSPSQLVHPTKPKSSTPRAVIILDDGPDESIPALERNISPEPLVSTATSSVADTPKSVSTSLDAADVRTLVQTQLKLGSATQQDKRKQSEINTQVTKRLPSADGRATVYVELTVFYLVYSKQSKKKSHPMLMRPKLSVVVQVPNDYVLAQVLTHAVPDLHSELQKLLKNKSLDEVKRAHLEWHQVFLNEMTHKNSQVLYRRTIDGDGVPVNDTTWYSPTMRMEDSTDLLSSLSSPFGILANYNPHTETDILSWYNDEEYPFDNGSPKKKYKEGNDDDDDRDTGPEYLHPDGLYRYYPPFHSGIEMADSFDVSAFDNPTTNEADPIPNTTVSQPRSIASFVSSWMGFDP